MKASQKELKNATEVQQNLDAARDAAEKAEAQVERTTQKVMEEANRTE